MTPAPAQFTTIVAQPVESAWFIRHPGKDGQ
jgi:hypothetical protein